MNKKRVLFIEDGNITEIIGKLNRTLKKAGITLDHVILNLKEDKFNKNHPTKENQTILDFDAIKEELKANHMGEKYDLVACDFSFLDENLTGFKLTKWLKNSSKSEKKVIRNAKYILYSSEKEKFLKETFTEEDMGALIKLKIEDFIDRERLADELATIIFSSAQEIDLSAKLICELDKFSELKFKSVYPKFEGKEIKEIIHEIENDSPHGILFQETLIELAVSHMIELNEE